MAKPPKPATPGKPSPAGGKKGGKKAASAPAPAAFLLLDRTGSMNAIWAEALSSLNVYAESLVKVSPETEITVLAFDSHGGTKIDTLRDAVRADAWKPLTDADATPRGMTPLFDAIARIVAAAEAADRPRTTIVVQTEGAENYSREASRDDAKAALDRAKARDWDVVFLGANFDAMGEAANLGHAGATTLNIAKGSFGAAMMDMAVRTASYNSGALRAGSVFSDAQRAHAAGRAGPKA